MGNLLRAVIVKVMVLLAKKCDGKDCIILIIDQPDPILNTVEDMVPRENTKRNEEQCSHQSYVHTKRI